MQRSVSRARRGLAVLGVVALAGVGAQVATASAATTGPVIHSNCIYGLSTTNGFALLRTCVRVASQNQTVTTFQIGVSAVLGSATFCDYRAQFSYEFDLAKSIGISGCTTFGSREQTLTIPRPADAPPLVNFVCTSITSGDGLKQYGSQPCIAFTVS